MIEQMEWRDVYKLWQRSGYTFSNVLTRPLYAETVFVEYNNGGYIYGYDWLKAEDARQRKQLIEDDPKEFWSNTNFSNKGTIQTAGMLMGTQNEEELAAIWIAATSKELSEYPIGNDIKRYTDMLYWAAYGFLRTRHITLWHHAMKKLVPTIMIPFSVLDNVVCKSAEPIMWFIQVNTLLLRNDWEILRYSSIRDI